MAMCKVSEFSSVSRYFFCILVLLILCIEIQAQGITVGRRGGRGYESGRYSVSAMYNIMWIGLDGGNDITGNGFSLEVLDRAYISPAEAFLVEWGLRGTYVISDDKMDGYDADFKQAFLCLPINFRLELSKKGSDFIVSPLLGVMLRWNMMGKHEIRAGNRTINIDYLGNSDERALNEITRWKRYFFDWQVGLSVDYKWFHSAVLYNTNSLSFALGVNF